MKKHGVLHKTQPAATTKTGLIGGLGPGCFGYLGSLIERESYLGVALESQTTGTQTTNLPLVKLQLRGQ